MVSNFMAILASRLTIAGVAIPAGVNLPWNAQSLSEHSTASRSHDPNTIPPLFHAEQSSPTRPDEDLPQTEMEQIQMDIHEIINYLMRFDTTIRQPLSQIALARAANIDKSSFQTYDMRHVKERFPNASDDLVFRLAAAIPSRQQYLAYREQHPEKMT